MFDIGSLRVMNEVIGLPSAILLLWKLSDPRIAELSGHAWGYTIPPSQVVYSANGSTVLPDELT